MKNIFTSEYRKFWTALLGAVLTVVAQYFADNQVVSIVVALAGALGVAVVPNKKS